jgi:O-antigen ligase
VKRVPEGEGLSAETAGGPFAVRAGAAGPGVWPTGRFTTVALAAVLLALLTPVVFLPGVLFPFVVPKAVWFRLVMAALAGLMLHRALTRRVALDWRGDPVFLALASLLAVSALAAAVGVAPTQSFFGDLGRMGGVWTLLHVVAFYVALRSLVAPERWPLVLRVLGGVVVALALSAFMDRYGVWVFAGARGRPGGFTGNPGYLGASMLLGAAVTGALAARSRGAERWGWIGAAALCIAVVFLSQTRAAMLGLLAAGPVAAASWVAVRGHGPARWLLAGAGTALLLGGLVLGVARLPAGDDGASAVPGAARLAETGAASGGARFYLWRKSLEAYGARPVLGWGPETEATAIGTRIDADFYRLWPTGARADRSHNAYLGLLLTTGPLGLAAFLAFLAAVLVAVRAGRRADRAGPAARADPARQLGDGAAALIWGAVVGYALYLAFWFEDLGVWVLLTTLAAWAASAAAGRPLVSFWATRRRASAPVLAGVWITLAVVVVVQGLLPLRQAALLGQAEFAAHLAVDQRLDLLDRAVRSPATQRLDAIVRHERYVQELFVDPEVRRDPVRLTRVLESAGIGLSAARAEAERRPWNDAIHARVASYAMALYQVTGDEELAEHARAALARSMAIAPARIRTLHLLSQVELAAGRADRAEAVLRDALAIHDGFGETHHYLAVVALDQGNAGDALAWVEESARLEWRPPGPSLHLQLGDALESAGRPGDAARVYWLYLSARHPALAEPGLEPASAVQPGELRAEDAEILARLPVARLRADDREGAMDAALLLGSQAPGLRGEMETFVTDVREGREGEWVGRATVVAPERARIALDRPGGGR